MKKIIGLAVIAITAIWFVVTLQTGKSTVNYLSEQIEEVNTLYGDMVRVELKWERQGWRQASGSLHVHSVLAFPFENIEWTENFQLNHGFLRSRLASRADLQVGEWLLSEHYGDHGITSTGVFSARGGAIEYVLSAFDYDLQIGTIKHSPAFLRIAMTENSQHSEFNLPTLAFYEEHQGRTIEGVSVQELIIRFQSELNDRRWPERQELSYAIGSFSGEYLPLTFENLLTQFNWQRAQEEIQFDITLLAPSGQYLNNHFSADVRMHGKGFDYETFMLINEKAARMRADMDEDEMLAEVESMVADLLSESVAKGFAMTVEHVQVDYEGLGRLRANGTGGIPPMAVESLSEMTFEGWIEALGFTFEVHEIPDMFRITLLTLGVPDRPLPWVVEYHTASGVAVNGKLLNE